MHFFGLRSRLQLVLITPDGILEAIGLAFLLIGGLGGGAMTGAPLSLTTACAFLLLFWGLLVAQLDGGWSVLAVSSVCIVLSTGQLHLSWLVGLGLFAVLEVQLANGKWLSGVVSAVCITLSLVSADGSPVLVSSSAERLLLPVAGILGALVVAVLRRHASLLHSFHQEQRELAIVRDRMAIARELHDRTAASLTRIALYAGQARPSQDAIVSDLM